LGSRSGSITDRSDKALGVMTKAMVGEKAPEFTTLDDTGRRVSLSDFSGKWVALFFYPKDDTPG
jgi:peroxiredoxin